MSQKIKELTPTELKQWIDAKKDFQLIDVREKFESDFCSIGGELIPVGSVIENADKISKDKGVVIYCRSGRRSGDIIQQLQNKFGWKNLYNLTGGILAWSDEVDNSIPKY